VEASILVPELSVEIDSTIPQTPSTASGTTDILKYRTRVVAYNTYNPRWNDTLNLRFDTYNSMLDLCFLRIEVKNQISVSEDVTVAHFCASLGSLELGELTNSLPNATLLADNSCFEGLRYIPLFDRQMSQFLYSTLLVQSRILPA
jgi:phosphatidylinositol phospholipase C delta